MISRILVCLLIMGLGCLGARCEGNTVSSLALNSYSCNEFNADVSAPNNAQRLLRPLMVISWAAGFSAARNVKGPSAAPLKLELVSAALKLLCKSRPDALVVNVFVAELKRQSRR